MRYKGTMIQQEAANMAGLAATYVISAPHASPYPTLSDRWASHWGDWTDWLVSQEPGGY